MTKGLDMPALMQGAKRFVMAVRSFLVRYLLDRLAI